MSRHGMSDCDGDWGDDHAELRMWAWTNGLERAIKGKRGQAMLRELADALDAMPVKRLVTMAFERTTGDVCALGCLGRARGVDMTDLNELARRDEEDAESDADEYGIREAAAQTFGIAKSLAAEVMYVNDQGDWGGAETPEERWNRVRRWVGSQITIGAGR